MSSDLLKAIKHLLKQRLGKVNLFTKPEKTVTVKGWGLDFKYFIFSGKGPCSMPGC